MRHFFLTKEALFPCYHLCKPLSSHSFFGPQQAHQMQRFRRRRWHFTATSFSILDNGLQLFYPFANSTVSDVDIADLATGCAVFDARLQNGPAVFKNQLLLSAFTAGQRGLTFSCWFRSSNSGTSARTFDFGNGPNAGNILFLWVCLDFSTSSERASGSLQPKTLICGTLGYMTEFCLLERRLSIHHYKISRLVEGLSIEGGGKLRAVYFWCSSCHLSTGYDI